MGWIGASTATGQAPLYLINSNTRVAKVSVQGNDTFNDGLLEAQIATYGPGFLDKLTFWNEGKPLFSPIELQKDVARLRRFYNRNGYLKPTIDYIAELDTASNTIRTVFTIDEGPPLIVQSLDFFGSTGRDALFQFEEGKEQLRWRQLRAEITELQIGDRLTDFKISRIRDQILERLMNRGYAFATVRPETRIDTVYNLADVNFTVDAGSQGFIDRIEVEGNESVTDDVVIRELPFWVGRRFEYRKLVDGQRQLFGLDLFRLALINVPGNQPRDSSVTVHVRVQEASLRYASAQTGFSRNTGVNLDGQWRHRNFLGGARRLTLRGEWETGFGATDQSDIPVGSKESASLTLEQPYIATNELSASLSPFALRQIASNIDYFEYGLSTRLIYEYHTFRPIIVEHRYSRVKPIRDTRRLIGSEFYDQNVFSVNAILGKADDYILPTRALLIKPFVEFAPAWTRSGVQYYKAGAEITFHRSLTDRIGISARVYGGRLWPVASSLDRLAEADTTTARRFNQIRFYAGGASDVRGWSRQALGPKALVVDSSGGSVNYAYVPLGGLAKLSANVDLRLPLPGLGPNWQTGVFLDLGQIGDRSGLGVRTFRFDPSSFRYAAGLGIRFRTPAGFLRLDVAYKLNPTTLDLISAHDLGENNRIPDTSLENHRRRFKLHVGIGQAF